MFVCAVCGEVTLPRTPAIRIVTDRQPCRYPARRRANVFWRPGPNGKLKEQVRDDPSGTGWAIAREVLACPPCAETWDRERF